MQAHPAGARLPGLCGLVVAQGWKLPPRLPAVGRLEQGGILNARVGGVRIVRRRLEMPDPGELEGPLRSVVPEVRAAHIPLLALSVRGQDECALACADQYSYTAHAVTPFRAWENSRSLLLLRGDLIAHALLGFPQLGCELRAEVVRLEHLAYLDLGLALDRIGAALDPLDRLFLRLHLKHPEAADQVFRVLEGPVHDRAPSPREPDARALRAGMQPFARQEDAGLCQLLVVLGHVGEELLARHDTRFRVLVGFHQDHEPHRQLLLALRGAFGRRLHAAETFLELTPEGLVHVHEEEDGPADEVVVTKHAPCDGGAIACGFERELRRVGRREGLHELELDPDQFARTALRDRHAPFADLAVAGPREHRALARRRALERVLRRGIELRPRRPGLPVVEIVDLREHRRRGGGDGRAPLDAELGRLQGHDQREHADDEHDDGGDTEQDLDQHGYRAPWSADGWDDPRMGASFQRP